jgi:hypothetical protein
MARRAPGETIYTREGMRIMADTNKQDTKSQDKNQAADMRPVPPQAEGDLETVEEDLARKQTNDASSADK